MPDNDEAIERDITATVIQIILQSGLVEPDDRPEIAASVVAMKLMEHLGIPSDLMALTLERALAAELPHVGNA